MRKPSSNYLPERPRSTRFQLRFTAAEFAQLQKLADSLGLSKAEVLRRGTDLLRGATLANSRQARKLASGE